MTYRWTPEGVAAHEARMKKWKSNDKITTHTIGLKDESIPQNAQNGRGRKHKLVGVKVLDRIQKRSRLELALLAQMEVENMETPHCEYKPFEHRRFRLDFAWPTPAIGVEVQGGVHRIKSKFGRDIEKRAELMLVGWRVLEVDADAIRDGRAIAWIKRLLE